MSSKANAHEEAAKEAPTRAVQSRRHRTFVERRVLNCGERGGGLPDVGGSMSRGPSAATWVPRVRLLCFSLHVEPPKFGAHDGEEGNGHWVLSSAMRAFGRPTRRTALGEDGRALPLFQPNVVY